MGHCNTSISIVGDIVENKPMQLRENTPIKNKTVKHAQYRVLCFPINMTINEIVRIQQEVSAPMMCVNKQWRV